MIYWSKPNRISPNLATTSVQSRVTLVLILMKVQKWRNVLRRAGMNILFWKQSWVKFTFRTYVERQTECHYKVYTEKTSFENAQKTCQADGGRVGLNFVSIGIWNLLTFLNQNLETPKYIFQSLLGTLFEIPILLQKKIFSNILSKCLQKMLIKQ